MADIHSEWEYGFVTCLTAGFSSRVGTPTRSFHTVSRAFFPFFGAIFQGFWSGFSKTFVCVSSLANTPLSLSCRGYTASAIDSKLLYGLHRANPFLQLLE